MGREVAISRHIPVLVKATSNGHDLQRTVLLAPLLDQVNRVGKSADEGCDTIWSQQARAILIRPGDNADRFVSATPSDPHNMGWGCTAIRGRKPTPRIGPSY